MDLVKWIVILMAFSVVFISAGKERKSKRKQTNESLVENDNNDEFVARTLDEWCSLSREALRLQCNDLHLLSSGSIPALAQRIYDLYHPPVSVSDNHETIASNLSLPVVNSATNTNTPNAVDITSIIREQVTLLLRSGEIVLPSRQQEVVPTGNSVNPPLPDNVGSFPPYGNVPAATNDPHLFTLNNSLSREPQSLGTSSSTNNLPPVPKQVLEKIKQGEFINFDTLLPSNTPSSTDEYTLKVSPGLDASVTLVPRSQARPKVNDFSSWLSAWNVYLRCMSFYFPHLINQLIYYQSLICQFASQYTFAAWSTYERLFRYRMAANPNILTWDRLDDDLFNRHLRGAPLQNLCYTCRNFGHMSAKCPLRVSSNVNSNFLPSSQVPPTNYVPPSNTVPQSRFQPPFPVPQRNAQSISSNICHFFNRGQCHNSQCAYAHRCRICYKDHPQSQCPRNKQQ